MARAARASQRPGPRSSTACLISPMERGLISHVVGLMLPQSAPACQAWMKHVRPPTLAAQEVMGESLPPLAQREFPPLLWAGERSKPAERCRGQAAPKEVRQANFRRQPSIATCDRIDRALEQRLYLLKLERHRAGAGGLFHVLGSTGNVYTVNVGTKPSCDCPDFLKGRGPCKHILFIWLRVLQLEED
ncbi:hypothetical protein AK812_SmicGene34728 [Symbiodinium microadriaticum]|uniref:SWIM-type domain-containing protein n=1 Tax=Symbiodinium microadriaticum TaxID=2951 RepID=A0A1Q9CNA8_SYMMI|nr:hypothetical protein AK812_SmicGene34728 [Symbiodinium microadriaticum]